MLKTILFYIKPYKTLYLLVMVTMILTSALESLNLMLLLPLFNLFLRPSGDIFQGVPGPISKLSLFFPVHDPMLSVFIMFICIALLKTFMEVLREWLKANTSGTIFYDIKKQFMTKYSLMTYQTVISKQQGALIYNCNVSSKIVASFLLRLLDGFSESFKILATLIVLAGMQIIPTIFAVIIGIFFYGVSHYLSKKVSYNIGRERVKCGTTQNIIINEFFNGIKTIIAFNAINRWLDKYDSQNAYFTKLFIKDNVWAYVPKYFMELTAVSVVFSSVVYLKLMHSEQYLSYLPLVGVFIFALLRLMPSISNIGKIRMELLGNLHELEVVKNALSERIPERRQGGKRFTNFSNSLNFVNVSFCYNQGSNILNDINISIEKGKITAIVGASGVGKSSLVNLILCLLDPVEGQIEIDGMDLNEIDPVDWRNFIGLVSQDTFIYHTSIRENICLGDNSYSQEEIVDAAKVASAHDFITALPEGYDTIAGERGMKLSGGQQQRLAIARALLKKPEILIFDEATSALDNVSEKIVQDAIYTLSKDHTVLIIAHRLSTVKHADKIIVLDGGRVVETGEHESLIQLNGCYAKLAKA